MSDQTPSPRPFVKSQPIEADLARLHRAYRALWLGRCMWLMVAAVTLAVVLTWLVMR